MKHHTDQNGDSQPDPLRQFLFHRFLQQQEGKLTLIELQALSERLRKAISAKTEGHVLTDDEAMSYRDNCSVIRKANRQLQLRNYSMLEIYEAEQWRAEYRSIEEFAKNVADLSKSQFMKCVKSADIILMMVDAGLGAVAPHGRMIEDVGKVQRNQRVAAWRYVLNAFKTFGKSTSVAQNALWNFCYTKKIPFGRIKPDRFRKFGLACRLLSARKNKATEKVTGKTTEQSADWTNNLSDTEVQAFFAVLNSDLQDKAKAKSDGKSPAAIIGETLREVASDDFNDQVAVHMESVLAILLQKDPSMVEMLYRQMLCQLSEVICHKIEQHLS